MREVDCIVIGSGPAGQRAAIQSAKLGKSVVLIDKSIALGGVCANTGTIPSKTLREAILYFSGYRHRNVYGRGYTLKEKLTFDDLFHRVNHVIKHENQITQDQLTRNGVEIISGTASFEEDHIVTATQEDEVRRFRADYIVIATGSTPYRASRVPFDGQIVIDSDTMWEPGFNGSALPKSILIVGAGVIGTEYACMFSALGIEVSLLDRREELFRFIDHEINEALLYHMRNERVSVYLGKDFSNIDVRNGHVHTTLENGREIVTDMLMFCSGRASATKSLNLEAIGIETGGRGLITVNEHFQTSVPHIYACGDVIGFPALASTSMEQGRCAALHAFDQPRSTGDRFMPYGIYTIPEISIVGKTEQELSEENTSYEIGIARYREIAKGQIMGDDTGLLKLIFDPKSGLLLGVHIIGDGASELIHVGQAVLRFEGKIDYFTDTTFNYPTLAEAYKVAALNGLKRMTGPIAERRAS